MNFLPAVEPKSLSIALGLLSIALLYFAAQMLLLAKESWLSAGAAIVVFLPLAWGVWRVNFYAIHLGRILLWIAIVGVVFGDIDAFEAMEWRELPSATWLLLHRVLPVVLPILAVLFVISRHRASWVPPSGA